ncbi:MAG: uroporphyrinogen decarboxylase [Deltaproteobacteria bacterium]|nr:uroporphyrinogen decarboxylase [Deltaproteobacteria bacterium]
MSESIARHGGVPLVVPSLREIPIENPPALQPFLEALRAGTIDVVIFLTGVGTRTLATALAPSFPREALAEALGGTLVVARGPKPVAALRELGARVDILVPEPNTWRELLTALDAATPLSRKRVAVQEYGVSNADLVRGLEARGAEVLPVPIYRWALPEDTGPLRASVREIAAGRVQVAMFTNATQVDHLFRIAREESLEDELRGALASMVVASVGPVCSEALRRERCPVDFEPSHPKMGPLIRETAEGAAEWLAAKREAALGPAVEMPRGEARAAPAADRQARLEESPFMKACRLKPAPYTPIWIMRQAGRYMPEYRAVRAKVGFLDLCRRPELVCEVTVTAAKRLGVDAAIIFSDILLPLDPMGARLEFVAGDGPVLHGAVGSAGAVDALREIDPLEFLPHVYEGIRLTRDALPPDIPLIGFAGAPFTLASYVCEGGASRSFEQTKTLMYRDPGAWRALMEKLTRTLGRHLNAQIAAGAQVVQIFDSWVGALSPRDYADHALPYTRDLIRSLTPGVPVIHFGTGTAGILHLMREAGGDVIGLDWRLDLAEGWARVGHDRGVQGNLDPMVLFAPPETIRERVRAILDAADGRPGHVFNLGHGILPQTSVDHAIALVEAVHEMSARRG